MLVPLQLSTVQLPQQRCSAAVAALLLQRYLSVHTCQPVVNTLRRACPPLQAGSMAPFPATFPELPQVRQVFSAVFAMALNILSLMCAGHLVGFEQSSCSAQIQASASATTFSSCPARIGRRTTRSLNCAMKRQMWAQRVGGSQCGMCLNHSLSHQQRQRPIGRATVIGKCRSLPPL